MSRNGELTKAIQRDPVRLVEFYTPKPLDKMTKDALTYQSEQAIQMARSFGIYVNSTNNWPTPRQS